MKHTEAEIVDALEVLKNTCICFEGCEDCPLREQDDGLTSNCYLMNKQPNDYDILELENQPRRLFND